MYYDLIDPSTGKPFTSSEALRKWADENFKCVGISSTDFREQTLARKAEIEAKKRAANNSETR